MINRIKASFIFPISEKVTNRSVKSKLEELRTFRNESKAIREEKRRKKLFEILTIANEKVPYYQDLFKSIDFDPSLVLKDIKYVQDIPFINKEIVRENAERFINTDFKESRLIKRKTGGSTGLTNDTYYDLEALDWTSAANLFSLEFTGRKHHNKECIISTEPKQEKIKHKISLSAKSIAMNRNVLYIDSLNEQTFSKVWRKLSIMNPYLVQGHPSTMYALSKFVKEKNLQKIKSIKAFESTGESLDKNKIASIEESIGCKVYNRFGNAEFGVFAHSKDNPFELEILDYIVHVENLSLGNGLEEMVLTTLTNKAMPLIRYQTGDYGEIQSKEDRDVLVNVHGRVHDIINIEGKDVPTHYIQSIMDEIGGIDEFQIVKNNQSRPTLKVVPSGKIKNEILLKQLIQKFNEQFKITFTTFNGLTRCGWRDKFKYIVKE